MNNKRHNEKAVRSRRGYNVGRKAKEDAKASDIPGFYYDSDKKKYFKILPGQTSGASSSFITKESIRKKQNEKLRLKDLQRLSTVRNDSGKGTKCRHSRVTVNCAQKHLNNTHNSCELRSLVTSGHITGYYTKCRISRSFVEHLKPVAHRKVIEGPISSYDKLEHLQKMFPSLQDSNNIVCMWSFKHILSHLIQTVSVKSVDREEGRTSLDLCLTGARIPNAFSKITSMCSALINVGNDVQEYVLFTTMPIVGNNSSLAMLRNLNCRDSHDYRYTEFNLSSKATWCCAWNQENQHFSVGTEKSGLLVDVETRSLWELQTEKSDVLSQEFNLQGNSLFSGTRKGFICEHDLRSKSTYYTRKLNHKSAVCHVKLTSDGRYLIASDFDSKIKKWDLRQRKVVMEYNGHNNTYSIIPFHIEESLNIVYGAGQDCYSRIWDLTSGELVKEIPPPHPAQITTIPTLFYSEYIGQKNSRPGLLIGMLDEIHFYSF